MITLDWDVSTRKIRSRNMNKFAIQACRLFSVCWLVAIFFHFRGVCSEFEKVLEFWYKTPYPNG